MFTLQPLSVENADLLFYDQPNRGDSYAYQQATEMLPPMPKDDLIRQFVPALSPDTNDIRGNAMAFALPPQILDINNLELTSEMLRVPEKENNNWWWLLLIPVGLYMLFTNKDKKRKKWNS